MKKLYVLILFIIACSTSQAQPEEKYSSDELSVSCGTVTLHELYDIWGRALTSVFTFGTYTMDSISYSPSYNVSYFHHINRKIAVGLLMSYQSSKVHEQSLWSELASGINGTVSRDRYFSFVPAIKFTFRNVHNWRFYGKGGLGITIDRTCTESNNVAYDNEKGQYVITQDPPTTYQYTDARLTCQFSVGIEYGKILCPFAEIGEGSEGLLQIGVRVHFGKIK